MTSNTTPSADYDRVYFAIERALYPDECPGMADAAVVKATQAVFRALGLAPR